MIASCDAAKMGILAPDRVRSYDQKQYLRQGQCSACRACSVLRHEGQLYLKPLCVHPTPCSLRVIRQLYIFCLCCLQVILAFGHGFCG